MSRKKGTRSNSWNTRGDQVAHDIYEKLNSTFITPLDPEEISGLTSALDDVLDYIDGSAEKMLYYRIENTNSHILELAKLIQLSVIEIEGGCQGYQGDIEPKIY